MITDDAELTAEFSTQVQERGLDQLLLFPNPVTSTLHVALPSPAVLLRVLATDGRIVMSRTNVPGTTTIDVQQLPSGAYSMEAVTSKGAVHRGRFIKQ